MTSAMIDMLNNALRAYNDGDFATAARLYRAVERESACRALWMEGKVEA